jgi:hypothetical protein
MLGCGALRREVPTPGEMSVYGLGSKSPTSSLTAMPGGQPDAFNDAGSRDRFNPAHIPERKFSQKSVLLLQGRKCFHTFKRSIVTPGPSDLQIRPKVGFVRQLREPVLIVDRLSTLSVHGLRMGRLLQDFVTDRRTDLGELIQQLPVLFVMPRGFRVVCGDAWHISIERPFLLQFPFERQELVNEVMVTVHVLVGHWDHLRLRHDGGVNCFPRDLIVFRGKQTCNFASQDVYTRLRTALVKSSDDMWFVVHDVSLTREAFDGHKAQRVEARMPGNPSPGQAYPQCSPARCL